MWKCKHCNEEFDFKTTSEKANHSRWCNKNPERNDTDGLKKAQQKNVESKSGKIKSFDVVCYNCGNQFKVDEREKQFPSKVKYFCCKSCSNSEGGKAKAIKYHPDVVAHYTTVCFRWHKKECIVCGENKIVAVHHNDGNHNNNDPMNLIPLCPTHHQYIHSRYKDEVQPLIDEYLKQF